MCQNLVHQPPHSVNGDGKPHTTEGALAIRLMTSKAQPNGHVLHPKIGETLLNIAALTCSGAIVMPRLGRLTRPCARIWSTSPRTVSMGMANPTPLKEPLPLGSRMPRFTPMTAPRLLSSTPPELPAHDKRKSSSAKVVACDMCCGP
jgi:hypothetical protein